MNRTNDDFIYDGPGYYCDVSGNRWLVGEDADGDLVGIQPQQGDPVVHYWKPTGKRFHSLEPHPYDLCGRLFDRQVDELNSKLNSCKRLAQTILKDHKL